MRLQLCPLPLALTQALICGALSGFDAHGAEASPDGAFQQPGFYTENFHILPEIEMTGYYDDNIYASKGNKSSDLIAVISPSLSLKSRWQRHDFKLKAGADLGRYSDNGAEDYDDLWLSGDGEIDLSAESQIYLSAGYSANHESRDSKEGASQPSEEPTTYDAQALQFGVNQRFAATAAKLGLTYERLDYDNLGTLFNDDRDRQEYGLGLRLDREFSSQTRIYAQAVLNRRDYAQARDQFGYVKDSAGYSAVVGAIREFARGDKIDAYAGRLYQDYDDNRFTQVGELNYGLDLHWYPAQMTRFTAKLERSLNETTEPGAANYLYSSLDLQLDQKFTADLVGYVNYNRGLAEFQDVGREDVTRTGSLGLKYYASPRIMISAGYSTIDNDSNDLNRVSAVAGTYDYRRNLLFLTLRARLAP